MLGTVLEALIMAVLANGLSLLDISPFVQQVVIGWVIIVAVLVNTVRKKGTWFVRGTSDEKIGRWFRRPQTEKAILPHKPLA